MWACSGPFSLTMAAVRVTQLWSKQNQWRVLEQRTHQKRIEKSQGFLFFCQRDHPPTSTQTISPSSSLMLPYKRQIDLDRRASKEENTNKLSIASSAFYLVQFFCDIDVATLLWPRVGVKPNTWKKWGFGVLRDSRMFRSQQQGPKHLALGCSWCHWKGLET